MNSLAGIAQRLAPPRMLLPYWLRERMLGRLFFKKTGQHMDFSAPSGFNQKIQWCKLYYYNPDLSIIADKVLFKEYVAKKLGEKRTAKLYGVWDDYGSIDLSQVPAPFVLKSNCSAYGKNVKLVFDKDQFDLDEARPALNEWLNPMNTFMGGYVRGYYEIQKPLIIAEEFLGEGTEAPVDYKFFCFDGEPHCAYAATEHFADGEAVPSAISFYDLSWKPLDVVYGDAERKDVPKPAHLEDMLRIARVLSKGFPFMRVDFYDREDACYVGEMTFASGEGFRVFSPQSFDQELGELFVLPPKDTRHQKFRLDVLKAYLSALGREYAGLTWHETAERG